MHKSTLLGKKAHESVRDCTNRLRNTLQDVQMKPKKIDLNIFRGLTKKIFHAHLYVRKHTCFNECCLDAMDYDDNFDISSVSSQEDQPRERHEPSKELTKITQKMLKKKQN